MRLCAASGADRSRAGVEGIVATTAALGVLLQEGIGDTIRASLTPLPNGDRTDEVIVSQQILQSLELRSFTPQVTACPGCGRTTSTFFQDMADQIQTYLREQMPVWKDSYTGVEEMKVAVMGCVVNGPGESKHSNLGISLPGTFEEPVAPVYVDGKLKCTLRGDAHRGGIYRDPERLCGAALRFENLRNHRSVKPDLATIIFVATYVALAIGRIPGLRVDRAGAALIGASLMVAAGVLKLDEAYHAINLDTIVLLLGMMIVVGNLRFSGFFGWRAGGWSGMRIIRWFCLRPLTLPRGCFSAFLVNDTVCLALRRWCSISSMTLRRDPVPYLLAVAMASNVGSVATLTGNPQNI